MGESRQASFNIGVDPNGGKRLPDNVSTRDWGQFNRRKKMEDRELWIFLRGCVVILSVLIVVGIPSCVYKSVKETDAVMEMVKAGADPIHAAVAARGIRSE